MTEGTSEIEKQTIRQRRKCQYIRDESAHILANMYLFIGDKIRPVHSCAIHELLDPTHNGIVNEKDLKLPVICNSLNNNNSTR